MRLAWRYTGMRGPAIGVPRGLDMRGARGGGVRGASVSAVGLARDEAALLGACLARLAWADELLVVDGGSRDATPRIAQARGTRVLAAPFELWDNFADMRNMALAAARCPWVLFVDADEEVSPSLRAEIGQLLRGGQGELRPAAYALPRCNILLGRPMRYGGWWPDRQVRLIQRGHGRYVGLVHEQFVPAGQGTIGRLHSPLIHRGHRSLGAVLRRVDRYADLEARQWQAAGRPAPACGSLLWRPLRHVLRRYIVQQGIRDGIPGLLEALVQGVYVFCCLVRARRLRGPDGRRGYWI